MPNQGDNIRVVVRGFHTSQRLRWETSFVWRVTAINENANLFSWLNTLTRSLDTAWRTASPRIDGQFGTDFSVESWVAVNLNQPTETAVSSQRLVGAANLGFQAPPELTMLIQLNTGVRGRSYTGRIYWPWQRLDHQDEGVISPVHVPAIQSFFNVLRFAGDTFNNGTLAVWSRALSTPEVVFATVTTGYTLRTRLYWQRRRRED